MPRTKTKPAKNPSNGTSPSAVPGVVLTLAETANCLTPSADADVFWNTHFGALRDDPYLEEMLRGIYERRGRPEVEDS